LSGSTSTMRSAKPSAWRVLFAATKATTAACSS
jgi:hypothetical protein